MENRMVKFAECIKELVDDSALRERYVNMMETHTAAELAEWLNTDTATAELVKQTAAIVKKWG